jgi:hypothetical protein
MMRYYDCGHPSQLGGYKCIEAGISDSMYVKNIYSLSPQQCYQGSHASDIAGYVSIAATLESMNLHADPVCPPENFVMAVISTCNGCVNLGVIEEFT